jgi:signal transduction histidine kinase
LFNLLSNAAKFTEQGEIRLCVAAENGWLVITLSDTGIGMTQDQLKRLFKPFSQADESTTRKYGGTGLGLAISKQFCEMMGGSISVTSNPGTGSTFTLRIPTALEQPEDLPQPTHAASAA